MNERLGPETLNTQNLPTELSARARRCISLAIRDGRLSDTQRLSEMSDLDIMWGIRGRGQPNGIGQKTLENIRTVYPRSSSVG